MESSVHLKATNGPKARFLPLIPLVLAQFAISSDTTTVAIAAGSIQAELGASIVDVQMMNMMFGLVAGMLMITGGYVGMVIGWNKTIRLGAVLALCGELAMAFAPSVSVLIWIGRTLVGVGASFLIPAVLGSVPKVYSGKNRAVAFACVTAGTGLAALVPIPYGIVIDLAGFRAAFLVSAAIFVLLLALTPILPRIEGCGQKMGHFDFAGFALSASGLFLILMGIAMASSCGILAASADAPFSIFGMSPCIPSICAGAILLAAFAANEQRRQSSDQPVLMPSSFFKTRAARHSLAAVAFGFFLSGSLNIAVIPYMQTVAGITAIQSGVLFACAGIPMILFSILISKTASATHPRTIVRAGYVASALGMFVLAVGIAQSDQFLWACFGMALAGAGIGTVNSQANNAVATAVGEKDAPQSGGMQGTVRDIAHALSTALAGTMLVILLGFNYNLAVESEAVLDGSAGDLLADAQIGLVSDQKCISELQTLGLGEEEQDAAFGAYAQARLSANQTLLGALGLASIALLAFTGKIPGKTESTRDVDPRRDGRCIGKRRDA